MAYGLLAGVSPSAGLYMAFFPTLVYFVFGTSRHISVGTLSVVSVMTLQIVQNYASPIFETVSPDGLPPVVANGTNIETLYTPNQVVTATAFVCGIQMVISIKLLMNIIVFIFTMIKIILSILQMGKVASLLSESLINGFTTGAAIHVLVSQLKDLFGVKVQRYKGLFQIVNVI